MSYLTSHLKSFVRTEYPKNISDLQLRETVEMLSGIKKKISFTNGYDTNRNKFAHDKVHFLNIDMVKIVLDVTVLV